MVPQFELDLWVLDLEQFKFRLQKAWRGCFGLATGSIKLASLQRLKSLELLTDTLAVRST